MYNYSITETQNGCSVYVNLISSIAGLYINRQPYLINLLKEVLKPMSLKGAELAIGYDMGRIIGNTEIVDTSDKDSVFYAQPQKNKNYSRYVKNRAMMPSRYLSLMLVQDDDGNYELVDTWIGPLSPPFPGSQKETVKSRQFWQSHALVADSQYIQSKTITKVCPY